MIEPTTLSVFDNADQGGTFIGRSRWECSRRLFDIQTSRPTVSKMETVAKNMIVLSQIWILKNTEDSNNESNNLIIKKIRITFLIRIARSLCSIKFFSRFTRAVKLGK